MISKIFSIRDQAADAFLPPFTLPTEEMAMRTFGDCINDQKHAFAQHPDHYTLFVLGTFDNETGLIARHESPMTCGNGTSYKTAQPQFELELAEVTEAIPQAIRK